MDDVLAFFLDIIIIDCIKYNKCSSKFGAIGTISCFFFYLKDSSKVGSANRSRFLDRQSIAGWLLPQLCT